MSSTQLSATSSERGGGAPLFSPIQSPTLERVPVTDQDSQAVATTEGSGAAPVGALVPTGTLADVSAMCQEAQNRIMTLQQAVGRQPGVTGQLNALINNDLRVVGQLFITAQHMCNTIDTRHINDLSKAKGESLELEQQIQTISRRLAEAESTVIELERIQQESDAGFTSYVEGLKAELVEKDKEIEDLRKELKARELKARRASLSSTTTAAGLSSALASDEETKYVSRLHPAPRMAAKDPEAIWEKNKGMKEELFARLSKIEEPIPRSPIDLEALRREARKKADAEATIKPPTKAELLHPQRIKTAATAAYTPPTREHFRSKPLIPTAREFRPTFASPASHSGFSPQYPPAPPVPRPSNALIRRDDDTDLDPEAKLWKDQFYQQFTMLLGWLQRHCGEIYPDVTARISRSQNGLWPFLCGLTYPHNLAAGHSHAIHMLNDPVLRPYFLLRAVLQYLEQNVWGVKLWLGFDRHQDRALLEACARADGVGYPLTERQFGIDTRKAIVQQFMKSREFLRFQGYKGREVVDRLKELTGPFLNPLVSKQEASLDLHVIATLAMELSTKMVTSRLTFNVSWLECGVKFADDTHSALNNSASGMTLQFKHYRVMLVVTPGISYRDESGRGVTARGVSKAQVLVMQ